MQRDYLLRLIEQVGQFLHRVIHQRERHAPHEALQSVMAACERLFGLEAVELFRLTPDQHVAMLVDRETPDDARAKLLMYAALNAEAGRCFAQLNRAEQAQRSAQLALRLTLRARADYGTDAWPDFAPSLPELLDTLGDAPLDEETAALLQTAGGAPPDR